MLFVKLYYVYSVPVSFVLGMLVMGASGIIPWAFVYKTNVSELVRYN